jgi:hypothetical protein
MCMTILAATITTVRLARAAAVARARRVVVRSGPGGLSLT